MLTNNAHRHPTTDPAQHRFRRFRVGVDLDGVLYDFVDSVRRWLILNGYDPKTLPDATRWEFYLDWGLTLLGFLQACHDGVDDGVIFRTGAPLPGTIAALARLREAGHEIHIVTDRSFGADPETSRRHTESWLAEVGAPFDTLTISADKGAVATDFFIDDRDVNFHRLNELGVNVYLINRPWNAHVNTDRRVDTVDDFVDLILEAAARPAA